ncbi:betaine/proline/choline family ABC transporter ATP-binding protein [Aerococcaceae bacterium DSM 109653]|uniref:Quaternary amine transport ATP-binding protein n=1 Tax=Fundicoccus ignavus TaxID=2664442 RepID=A0A6I2GBZ8_9LACT|nr:glycine betaine/L-proline ABC transporter ATP-binding protein [Fundicoccus ignavus]MRI80524.1 betaine/proline/choline family ABC transporter ATP-binding protein [Fundicoccus ignavus]MRI84756.1 betaine/proline/choline family ABC transporter ATP-binding protein [Fundicoccus ignavus]
MTKLKVEKLTKIYGKNESKALELMSAGKSKEEVLELTGSTIGVNQASFEVNEGEIFVIMGLSGSGKSSLVRMLNRLVEPSSGDIYIDGVNITDMKPKALRDVRRKKISMVFQNFALFPHRTILENTEYGLEVQGVTPNERRAKAEQALENAGLIAYKDQYPDQLSGGMQQRVGLARALANDPDILLMDEAFSALDPLIRRDMQDELLEMQKTMNKTIIFITHDLNESLRLGSRIAIMKDGEVVQIGTGEEILSNPANEYVTRFVEDIDRTKVYTAEHIMEEPTAVTQSMEKPSVALQMMEDEGMSNILVVDDQQQLVGYVTHEEVEKLHDNDHETISSAIQSDVPEVSSGILIDDLFDVIHESETPVAVTDKDGKIEGVIVRSNVIGAMTSDYDTNDTNNGKESDNNE